jgi:hypothetical protein
MYFWAERITEYVNEKAGKRVVGNGDLLRFIEHLTYEVLGWDRLAEIEEEQERRDKF